MPTLCQPYANYNYSSFSSFDGLGPYAIGHIPLGPTLISSFSSFDGLGPYAILTPTQAKLFWMPDIFIDKVKVYQQYQFILNDFWFENVNIVNELKLSLVCQSLSLLHLVFI